MKTCTKEARKPALGSLRERSAVSNWQLAVSKSKFKPDPKSESLPLPAEAQKPKRRRRGKFTLKDLNYPDQRVVRFPMAAGKKTEAVELLTSANSHCITVEFADRT